ncbi:MAG: outer membrane protein transport protein [candidate division KSB1 bacterium]|nr:outer membrane protein transport protein [candidate division KSB1 bacterium]MDZ7302666.1 outer membrane protein transport protein [candidate division KSB1 bacterium]MDZ7311804.1 outer membrane protein transport protein [candidate division KSB1 bacterium]
MRKGILVLLLPLLAAGPVLAGGFNIYEFGGRASAMGGAVVARSWDGSTIFYNPSGLAFLKGTHFYGGTTLILPKASFVGAAPIWGTEVQKTKDALYYPVGVYFAHNFNGKLAAGIGLTNPFGLGVEWKDDFTGRGVSRNSQLQSFYISPVAAYQILPNLSIGGGLDIVIATVLLERNVYIFDSPGSPGYEVGKVKLKGTSEVGLGFTASAMYRTEKLGLGFLYRHSTKNEFKEGDADFTIFDNLTVPNVAAVAQNVLKDQKASTSLDFPNFFSAGIYYQLTKKLGAEVDYMWFNWSIFDEIALHFKETSSLDQTVPEEYKDSWQLRVGTHYELTDKISLRAGYIFDQSPEPIQSVSPLLPDSDRHDFSIGLGYNFGKYQLDLGYMMVLAGERSTVENGVGKNHYGFDGTYNTRADLFFGSFGINF